MSSRFGFLSKVFGGSKTLAYLKEFFQAAAGGRRKTALIILTKHGERFSLVAGSDYYSEPRNDFGPWSEVEVGVFGLHDIPALKKYLESGDSSLTVYKYVPLQVIAKVVDNYGGIAQAENRNRN